MTTELTSSDLTSSDLTILRQLAQGSDAVRIAARLGVPVRVVRADVRRIRHALGARNTVHAVVIAVRARLI